MLHRPKLLLALTLVTPVALAQDPGNRVLREASNPLRMILEASRIKPRAKGMDAARPAPRTAAEATAAPAPPVAAESTQASVQSEPSPVPTPAGTAPSTVATLEVPAAAEAAEVRSVPEPPRPPPESESGALQLATVVEPVMPRQLLGKLRGEVQVLVAFTVNADGTVADAAVRRSTHPQVDTSVLEAVRQWRYQPIAGPRAHEVQLVLRAPD
jgi:TonB family protein